jgi:hypothetical protein
MEPKKRFTKSQERFRTSHASEAARRVKGRMPGVNPLTPTSFTKNCFLAWLRKGIFCWESKDCLEPNQIFTKIAGVICTLRKTLWLA